jgi:hypothetical protein
VPSSAASVVDVASPHHQQKKKGFNVGDTCFTDIGGAFRPRSGRCINVLSRPEDVDDDDDDEEDDQERFEEVHEYGQYLGETCVPPKGRGGDYGRCCVEFVTDTNTIILVRVLIQYVGACS